MRRLAERLPMFNDIERMPAGAGAEDQQPRPCSAAYLERAGMKRCLIVDDSRVVRKVARRIVEDLRFDADEAADGQQALDACRKEMPDAVLLDWNMPIMNGIDFLRALRREPGGERPVVVFCTTENDMNHIAEAMRSGANEYIMKPFDSEIIESKFSEVGLV
jgi:two-component system chemotaxis response regulator CheY